MWTAFKRAARAVTEVGEVLLPFGLAAVCETVFPQMTPLEREALATSALVTAASLGGFKLGRCFEAAKRSRSSEGDSPPEDDQPHDELDALKQRVEALERAQRRPPPRPIHPA